MKSYDSILYLIEGIKLSPKKTVYFSEFVDFKYFAQWWIIWGIHMNRKNFKWEKKKLNKLENIGKYFELKILHIKIVIESDPL